MYEPARININNYKINLFDCKNGHNINNILLNEFENTQYIDESLIKCNKCQENNKFNTYNHIFYKCNICKINLCPLCKEQHSESHNIIDYNKKNYICDVHNDMYIAYCKTCKKNICSYCFDDHEKHDIIYYNKIISKKDIKINQLKNLRDLLDKMNDSINEIINKLSTAKENMESYYKICDSIINNYNIQNKNYELLNNLNDIINHEIINDISNIINENNINNKFNKIMIIYNKIKNTENNNCLKSDPINRINEISNEFNVKRKDEMKNDNIDEVRIQYKLNGNENTVKIFSSIFVKNNKDKCKIIYQNKEYELKENWNLQCNNNKI